ncbi:MAG: hypothetical protein ACTHLU_13860 [Novosphingobium sp.]
MTDRNDRSTGVPTRPAPQPDAELERERLEPGPNTAGIGDVGADPARPPRPENSNT